MSNVFKASIRRLGRRLGSEEARLELYNEDGSPFDPGAGSEAQSTEDWIPVPDSELQANGWDHFNASAKVVYRKRPDGIVEMRGMAAPGTIGVTLFTLPVGYRHDQGLSLYFWLPAQGDKHGILKIQPSGVVTVDAPATLDATWYAFSGVRFSID